MSDIDIVARTLYGEARSLGYMGMSAVANVIMNRVAANFKGDTTPTAVCLHHYDNVYQFDCNDPADPNFEVCQNVTEVDPDFALAMQIATKAVNHLLPDATRGSLNYYSDNGQPTPDWAVGKMPTLTVKNTKFYNDIP